MPPSSAAAGSSGPSGWENATPPHGNPPNGMTARNDSPATQAAAANTGHTGSRRDATAASTAAGPTSRASVTESPSHGTDPT